MDLGFTSPASLYLAGTEIPGDARPGRLRRLIESLHAVPGVSMATVSTMVPLGFGGHRYSDVQPEGFTASPDDNVSAERVVVGASYFGTMGTRLAGGRDFSEADRAGRQAVVIVNESFARRFWPGADALGRKVTQAGRTGTVVGIAQDGRYRNLDDANYPVVYWPIEQVWEPRFTVILRSAAPTWDELRTAFDAAGPDVPVLAPRTLAEHIRAATFVQEAGAPFLGGFGSLALIMAMIGVYATLAHGVSTRVREIGAHVAVDDFGTGYSSLDSLKRLPISTLKIDRSFVHGMVHNENLVVIVHSTINLAHNLGMRVVAEGVEDQETLDLLEQFGCDRAQGYFISRPMSSAALADWCQAA